MRTVNGSRLSDTISCYGGRERHHSQSLLSMRRSELRTAERFQRPLVAHVDLLRRLPRAGIVSFPLGRGTVGAGGHLARMRRGVRAEVAVAVHGQCAREPGEESQWPVTSW